MVEDAVYVIRETIRWFKGRKTYSDEAVNAFLTAVHMTEAYIADRTRTGEDRNREAELVSLWN